MDKNLNAKANSRKPRTTLTELSQPPDLGRRFIHSGKMAKSVNGIAKADPKANIPRTGFTNSPPADEIKIEPTIGPVQEKETSTRVKAMKNTPASPPCSALASTLLTKLEGSVISYRPRNDKAKKIKIPKKNRFGAQCVASQLANSGPWMAATAVPAMVYIAIMEMP